MMGPTHALSGAAAWLAAVPLLQSAELMQGHAVQLSAGQIAAGTVVCAGAAMLPDIDHHDGTIANTFGVLTKVLCRAVGKVSGGHRQATHSILFALGAGYGAHWLAAHQEPVWWALLFLLVGLGLRGLGIRIGANDAYTGVLNALAAAALVFWMHDLDMLWAGYAVALGCLMHLAGDCCTPRGCPVLWPAPWRLAVPLVPRTNGRMEKWVITPVLTLGVVILAVRTAVGDEVANWLENGV
ncbi:metal-dependent hydrolase [Actinocorallia populi]|uniref:metal-dependent hydrolase n=1 Tax=Actinocorallia populi TaxID=2079200 RepID=UPI0018E5720E|nr:metal-dependent hydrolase [Actinocorallia populi]